MKLESCAGRKKLEFGVTAATQMTYIARRALQAAKINKRADTARFIVALKRARAKLRDAQNAHERHVDEHRCGPNGISLTHQAS